MQNLDPELKLDSHQLGNSKLFGSRKSILDHREQETNFLNKLPTSSRARKICWKQLLAVLLAPTQPDQPIQACMCVSTPPASFPAPLTRSLSSCRHHGSAPSRCGFCPRDAPASPQPFSERASVHPRTCPFHTGQCPGTGPALVPSPPSLGTSKLRGLPGTRAGKGGVTSLLVRCSHPLHRARAGTRPLILLFSLFHEETG